MPRPLEQGELALKDYNPLRYSFVNVCAGEQRVLTSDPWSFLNSHLQSVCRHVRGENRTRTERAIYYASLAEDFYRAADSSALPAKGTLLYYGMLDLVKCYLSLTGSELETVHEHHGLSLPLGEAMTIEVKKDASSAVFIFAAFCAQLGVKVPQSAKVDLRSALSHIPEIHGMYTSLGHAQKRKFLPVEIEFLVNTARDMLFTEVVFDKEQETKVDVSRFLKGRRKVYFREGYPRPKKVVYRASRKKRYTRQHVDRTYKKILADYRRLDVVPILTSSGYRYYVDLRPGDYPHLAYRLMAMYYLGTAARYRPLEINELLQSDLRPLVSEFVSLAPRQFLYQMVSLCTNRECVIPFAAI